MQFLNRLFSKSMIILFLSGLATYLFAYVGVGFVFGLLEMIVSFVSKYKTIDIYPDIKPFFLWIAYSFVFVSQGCISFFIGKKSKRLSFLDPMIFGMGSLLPALIGQPWTWSLFMFILICCFSIPLAYFYGGQYQRQSPILTQRETEIASFVCQGNTNKEIAKLLFIEESTVKNHLQSIYQKYNVRNRVELTRRFS